MSLARQSKGPRKDSPHGQAPAQPRRGGGPGGGGAWRGPHNNPSIMQNFSPRTPPTMLAQLSHTPTPGSPGSSANQIGLSSPKSTASSLPPPPPPTLPPPNVTGSIIIVTTHSGVRHEGTLVQGNQGPPGISLENARDIVNPNAPVIPSYFIPAQQIKNWMRPDPTPTVSANGTKALDSFRIDRDISTTSASIPPRERELQAWKPDGPSGHDQSLGLANGGVNGSGTWDQFSANEKLFGVTTDYQEDIYTTRLDRSTADFKEKERKAQQIADEITSGGSSNPHILEERGHNVDSGAGEEEKYGAVVRGPNAYVPPGARRVETNGIMSKPSTPGASATPPSVPKVSVNGQDVPVDGAAKTDEPDSISPANGTAEKVSSTPGGKHEDPGVIASFRDFVSNEKQKLAQKKQAIAKHEMDKRLADLVNFSASFKLNKPIPSDLVPILAKDEDKQKAIVEKSAKDAGSKDARTIGNSNTPATGALPIPNAGPTGAPVAIPAPSAPPKPANRVPVIQPIPPFKGATKAAGSGKPSATGSPASTATSPAMKSAASTGKEGAVAPGRSQIKMTIAKIPPFDPSKRRVNSNDPAAQEKSANGTSPITTPGSPTASVSSSKLNANASSFRPNPNATAFKPGSSTNVASSSSPKKNTTELAVTPNPYFGVRYVKKGGAVHIKDDFNPFKFSKVADAASVPAVWPFNGRRYMQMFPAIQHPPPVVPHVPAPPSYEEDREAQQAAAVQQAARMGTYPMMFYNPYQAYPGAQPPPQHMMAAPNGPPPAGYVGSPYMQPMQYPQGVPTAGGPMYAPQMPGMPPAQPYMQGPPPQGAYPPNNGPRGSMPPTPIPQHAYAAYHQSPQMAHQHALPYQMMMPPPGGALPHGYEAQQPGPGPMGVGH